MVIWVLKKIKNGKKTTSDELESRVNNFSLLTSKCEIDLKHEPASDFYFCVASYRQWMNEWMNG